FLPGQGDVWRCLLSGALHCAAHEAGQQTDVRGVAMIEGVEFSGECCQRARYRLIPVDRADNEGAHAAGIISRIAGAFSPLALPRKRFPRGIADGRHSRQHHHSQTLVPRCWFSTSGPVYKLIVGKQPYRSALPANHPEGKPDNTFKSRVLVEGAAVDCLLCFHQLEQRLREILLRRAARGLFLKLLHERGSSQKLLEGPSVEGKSLGHIDAYSKASLNREAK